MSTYPFLADCNCVYYYRVFYVMLLQNATVHFCVRWVVPWSITFDNCLFFYFTPLLPVTIQHLYSNLSKDILKLLSNILVLHPLPTPSNFRVNALFLF